MSFQVERAAQINMYAMDERHVAHLLPHQIRVWAPMVDRVVVTLDTHRSRAGRYRGTDVDAALRRLRAQLAAIGAGEPKLVVQEVDYTASARREVARAWFGRDDMPVKAWDGGPFYAYFYGLQHARARHVVHFDGDMLFGGGSTTWLDEALAVMAADPTVLLTSPLPGPPRADGVLRNHGEAPEPVTLAGHPGWRFRHASTRIFMLDVQRLRARLGHLPLLAPGLAQRLKARLLGNPPHAREAEVILGEVLRRDGLWRVDFLGSGAGMWSLHPPYRNADFYARLPALIDAVERGAVPEAQRGDYDMNDSMVDWSAQRAANRRHLRLLRLLRDRVSGWFG